MKKAIVTGATSFLGKQLIKTLLNNGYFVYGVVRENSNKLTGTEDNCNFEKVYCSMENLCNLANKISGADVFFHLAWEGTRGQDRANEIMQQSNYQNSVNALMVANKLGCKTFVGAGSQAEYGVKDGIIKESDSTNPNTQYGKYKLKFTNTALEKCKELNMRCIIPRIFAIFGINDYENTVVQSTVTKMLNGQDCLLTRCVQNWNFIYLEDTVKAIFHLYKSGASGIFNIASNDTRQLKDFIVEIKKQTESKSQLLFGAVDYPSTGMVSINPSVEKLLDTGFTYDYTFESGLKEIIQFEKNKKVE